MKSNPYYTRKLQSALITAGKTVESNTRKPTPTMDELKALFDKFTGSSDMSGQAKAVNELISGLVKWEVEKL